MNKIQAFKAFINRCIRAYSLWDLESYGDKPRSLWFVVQVLAVYTYRFFADMLVRRKDKARIKDWT